MICECGGTTKTHQTKTGYVRTCKVCGRRHELPKAEDSRTTGMNLLKHPISYTLKIYKSKGKYRWCLVHANGNIVAASSGSYPVKANARNNAIRTRDGLIDALGEAP